MKVKMKEYYNDKNNHFEPRQVVDVSDVLGEWLLEHRKAEAVKVEHSVRHLDVSPQFEQAEEPPAPVMSTQSQPFEKPKRSRRVRK